ncbi:SH3 domain-containing protein [Streptomyces abyssomicinicus]|uniref:SH3 domain-containing protein n=1 Tax=Streptomyces abyssomicinicus TaxID=574929 RepID=UPI0012507EC6|nr:SH3 domain-containing protein [Streptomyces abyssomicinicus]
MALRRSLSRVAMSAAATALLLTGAAPAVADAHPTPPGDRFFKGLVTARGGLQLHTSPTTGSEVIGFAPKGSVVDIFCKAPGQTVDGNPLWYLLADGTWAWGPARYIDNIGPAPRWC